MKARNASQPGRGTGRRISPMRIPQIPMEWMDPMSWRLPSGKALAEFALQTGFLAPLMLGTPNFRKKKKMAATVADGGDIKAMDIKAMDIKAADVGGMDIGGMEKQRGEGPETSGTFRNDAGRGTGREAR
jgi:hypothetical protein